MTPHDIYLLPSKRTDQWYHTSPELWNTLFGIIPDIQSEGDIEKNELNASSNRLTVEQKLDCFLDWGERTATLAAVYMDGVPFALVATAGRGEADFGEIIVTNAELFDKAFLYFVSKAVRPHGHKPEISSASEHYELLDGFYGAAIIKTADGIQMVRTEYVDDDNKLLFDVRKYNDAFEAARPFLRQFNLSDSVLANNAEVRSVIADAIAKGVAEDARQIVVNRRTKKTEKDGDWIAAAAANDSGTYALGIRSWSYQGAGLSWGSEVFCEKIGDAALFDELKASITGAVRDGMKP